MRATRTPETCRSASPRRGTGRGFAWSIGAALTLTLAACASTSANSAASSAAPAATTSPAPLASQLPASIRQASVITVASLDDLPPWDFTVGGAFQGIDVDLTSAIGKLLGVTFKYENIDFTGQIPGLEAGRFNLIIDEIGDTPAREQAVSFVDYSSESTAIVVKAGDPEHVSGIADLCGKTVAVVPASIPEQQAKAQSGLCTKSGKPAVTIIDVPTVTATYLAIASGRADATLNGYSTAAYSIKQGGITTGLTVAPGALFQPALNGFAFSNSDPQLGKAIQDALNMIMQNGQYRAIMAKWNVAPLALGSATINNAAAYAAAHGSSS